MRAWLWFFFFTVLLNGSHAEISLNPSRGLYQEPFVATITSSTPGELLYTTDGALPDLTHGKPYDKGVKIAGTTVLRASVVDAQGLSAEAAE